MSKKNEFIDTLSQFGAWLAGPLDELRESLVQLWRNARQKHQLRRQERQRKRTRHRMRSTTFWRQIGLMLLFSLIYWGIVFLIFDVPELYDMIWLSLCLCRFSSFSPAKPICPMCQPLC